MPSTPLVFVTGVQINDDSEIDNRSVYPTAAAALTTGATVGGLQKPRIAATRRYEGLASWITEEQVLRRFIGGTTDEHFVVDPAYTGGNTDFGDMSNLIYKLQSEGYLT